MTMGNGGWAGDEGEYRHRRETERQRGTMPTNTKYPAPLL
jgi:hypothetical protein